MNISEQITVVIVALGLIGANEGSRYMVYELEKEHKKSSLMCKKKEELVKEIMRLEHNVNVMNERLNNQANAIKHYEQKSRAKAIEEFAEKISLEISESIIYGMIFDNRDNSSFDITDKIVDYVIDTAKKIAEEMRGAE